MEGVSLGQLQRDLAGTYHWSGSFWRDYAFFVANWHPLVGILCSHPWHPWSKKERIGIFVFSVALTFYALVLRCHLVDWSSEASVYLGVTLPVMAAEALLYQLAVLDARCRDRSCCALRRLCHAAMRAAQLARSCAFCVALVSSLAVGALSVFVVAPATECPLRGLGAQLLWSRCQSWLTWFPIWFFLPLMGFLHCWCMERSVEERSARRARARMASRT